MRKQKTSRQESILTLDQLTQMLENHMWPFQAENYANLHSSVQRTHELFRLAQTLSMKGVSTFHYAQHNAIQLLRDESYDIGYKRGRETGEAQINYLLQALEETRQKYMKPVDFFKEKLERHDWYWQYSDDGNVARNASRREDEIIAEAKTNPEFQKALDEKRAALREAERKQEIQNGYNRQMKAVEKPKAVCENWSARPIEGSEPNGLIGMWILHGLDSSGQTTEILAVHSYEPLFLTRSGSVYRFGSPEPTFASEHPELVKQARVRVK